MPAFKVALPLCGFLCVCDADALWSHVNPSTVNTPCSLHFRSTIYALQTRQICLVLGALCRLPWVQGLSFILNLGK